MSDEAPNGHLSIGEVLSLVQQDFPDVSISKIRFLESQGLIAPERTASGYRKFYDADIDRLRWILRQQRDHFLPLKVIKKMLDQGVETADGDQSQPSLFAEPEPDGSDDAAAEADAEVPDSLERSRAHPAVASAPAKATTTVRTANPPEQAPAGTPSEQGASERPQRQGHATPADVVAALQEGPSTPRRRARGAPAGDTAPGPVTPSHRRSVASAAVSANERLTRDELIDAAGIDDAQLDALEQYGLVIAVAIGNSPTYDAESLEVARLAVRYAALGVEARHLRMYKVSAEREAGFVEQLVVPLLKQRNPAARQQAIDRADELAAMGSDLHAALLRQRLGPVIGP